MTVQLFLQSHFLYFLCQIIRNYEFSSYVSWEKVSKKSVSLFINEFNWIMLARKKLFFFVNFLLRNEIFLVGFYKKKLICHMSRFLWEKKNTIYRNKAVRFYETSPFYIQWPIQWQYESLMWVEIVSILFIWFKMT